MFDVIFHLHEYTHRPSAVCFGFSPLSTEQFLIFCCWFELFFFWRLISEAKGQRAGEENCSLHAASEGKVTRAGLSEGDDPDNMKIINIYIYIYIYNTKY